VFAASRAIKIFLAAKPLFSPSDIAGIFAATLVFAAKRLWGGVVNCVTFNFRT
jgi:hypothetical protein